MTDRPIRRALLSVSDKTGLVELARALAARNVALVSTGGTARALREAGLPVEDVSDVTGFPEILDGRVKTLHPAIHGGILADRSRPGHVAALERHGLAAIDLVVVNLYPFEWTVAAGAGFAEVIESIDIGGPALVRAAAKNHGSVAVVTDPADYGRVLAELDERGAIGPDLRLELAARAFARTAAYDAAIAAWLAREPFPERLTVAATRRQVTRYGENPHQRAAFYVTSAARPGVASARQVQGKELSYNNLADTDAAFELVAELEAPAVAIIKHANPCGVAVAEDLVRAHAAALACDPVSAYGGIVACNRPLDKATAEAITRVFTEVVIAPGAEEAAIELFGTKPNLRLLLTDAMPDPLAPGTVLRSVAGGLLVQDRDARRVGEADLRAATRRPPDERELRDLLFAFTVAKHVKSNAIVLARGGATIGIGAGQMSRLDSVRIAVDKARAAQPALLEGCVVASDAFFPFPDALEEAIAAGAVAAIQPGGSLRDDEVTASADAAGIAMLLTGVRHFRH
jgi:phosphoribosylaminoimidazolecarboxamide formyltransferase / IMP cyclohydrolase